MLAPELIHFFSYATGVSLELPRGFVVAGSTDTSQSYVRYGADDTTATGYLDIRRLAATEPGAYDAAALRAAVTAAVDSMAVGAATESDRHWLTVDRADMLATTLRYPGGLPGAGTGGSGPVVDLLTGEVAVLFAATVVGRVLISLMGATRPSDDLGVFADALDTVRFVIGAVA